MSLRVRRAVVSSLVSHSTRPFVVGSNAHLSKNLKAAHSEQEKFYFPFLLRFLIDTLERVGIIQGDFPFIRLNRVLSAV